MRVQRDEVVFLRRLLAEPLADLAHQGQLLVVLRKKIQWTNKTNLTKQLKSKWKL